MGCFKAHASGAASNPAAQAQPENDTPVPDFFSTLTRQEQDWLKAHPVIRLGFAVNRPPYEFLDAQGRKTGMVAAYLDLFEKRLHVRFKRLRRPDGSPLSWEQIQAAGRSKNLDVIASLMRTRERTTYLGFTRPYMDFPWAFVAQQNTGTTGEISDFYGQTAAVVAGYPVAKQLPFLYPELKFILVETPLQGLLAVSQGKAAIFINNAADAVYLMKKQSLSQLKIAGILPDIDSKLRIGVRKDWPILVDLLDKAVASLTLQETAAIHNKWIRFDFHHRTHWKKILSIVIPVVLVVLIVIVVILIANRRLQKEVNIRKETENALRESEAHSRQLLESVGGGVMEVDTGGMLRFVNGHALAMLGYCAKDLAGQPVHNLIHHTDKAGKTCLPLNCPLYQAYAGEEKSHVTSDVFWKKDGTPLPVEYMANPIYKRQKFTGAVISFVNITQRLAAEEEIRQSQDHLKFVLEAAGGHSWLNDLETGTLSYNSLGLFKNAGYSEKEIPLTVDAYFALAHPDDQPVLKETFSRFLQGKLETIKNDYWLRKKDAGWLRLHSIGRPVEWNEYGQATKMAGLSMDITERHALMEKVTQSQERLKFVMDTADAYFWEHDLKTDLITHSSIQCFLRHGYTENNIPRTGTEVFECLHPDDRKIIEMELQKHFDGDGPSVRLFFRFRSKKPDSSWFWMNSVCKSIEWDSQGRPIKYAGLNQDVTERQNLHEEIKASQEMLRIISKHTYDWQVWWDLNDRLVWMNQAVERVTGYSVEECMAMADYPWPLIDERDWELFRDKSKKTLQGQGRQECILRIHRKDGARIFVSAAYEPVQDKNGQITGLVSVAKDITEQKEAERGLRLMLRVFEDGADPIIITDLSGIILELNVAAIKVYGYSRKELLGKEIGVLASKEEGARGKALFKRCINGEILKHVEGTRIRKDGSMIPLLLTFSLLKNDEGKPLGVASMAKDISELKQAEKELKDYRDHLEDLVRERTSDLEEAKLMAEEATKAKSDFLANMSHEIRTPLNAIIGFTHLARQTALNGLQLDYIHKIQNGSKALLGVINDILDFSKIEAGKLSMEFIEFPIEDVLDTVTDLVGIKAQEKGLEVVYNIEPSIPNMLVGDPVRLGQILLNLTNNAVKFTRTGEIVLGCELSENGADEAQLKFYIQDSGIGLTREQQNRLFQAFSQADSSTTRKYGGTGLGLFISKSLVEMMNGRIWVESEYGKGTTFFFTVCLKRVNSDTITSQLTNSDIHHKKILVVDDNYISRTVLAKMLEAMSFTVIQCESAEACFVELASAGKAGTPFDLVFMDWQMPGMDGLRASEKIKTQMYENIPSIIMVSAYAREAVMHQAKRIGLDGYLIKPVSPSLLADSIVSALGGKAFTHPCGSIKHETLPDIADIKGAKLLVAEDNEVNQQVARGILENNGFVVDLADNGRQAVAALNNNQYDAVLMDINMPEMDGYTASRQIRKNQQFKHLPIIAMTANAMTGDRKKALDAGMNDHVAKPIDVKALLNVLRKWVCPVQKDISQAFELAPPVSDKKTDFHACFADFDPVPGIDIDDGLGRLAGDHDLYRDLLIKFAENQADAGDKIAHAMQANDMDTAQRLAHTIKGVAGNIGATSLFGAATLLDTALKQENIQDVLNSLPDFTALLDEVVQGINAMEQNQTTAGPHPEEPGIDPKALKPLLIKLHALLEDDDTESGIVARQIKEKIGKNASSILLDKLSRKISEYDFDEAKEVLKFFCQDLGIEL